MGCTSSHQELISRTYKEFEDRSEKKYIDNLIELAKGGIIIQTVLGNIQYGIPPESVKDSLALGIEVPEYYIIPEEKFNFEDGISLVEIEFPIYYNFFFKKKKTVFICTEDLRLKVLTIFRETLLGPENFDEFEKDFVNGYKAQPDIVKELKHFAKNPFSPGTNLNLEMFIEFVIFNKKNEAILQKKINFEEEEKLIQIKIESKKSGYFIYENNKFLLTLKKAVNVIKKEYKIYKTLSANKLFQPPLFGITALGCSHGFDKCGSTSGFIIWINRKGVIIDPPPYSSSALRNEGIPPNLIQKLILTHCHADHDAGAFHKIVESSPIEFLTTNTIMNSFLRKYSAQSDVPIDELEKLFHYRKIKIGHSYNILGGLFTFYYSFHSIPCLSIEVEFLNKKFYLSGDTFYNPKELKKYYQQGLFNKERYEELAERDLSQYDLIFHEAGIPPIHTPIEVLQQLSSDIKKKIFLYHIAKKDMPDKELTGLKRVKPGLNNTYVIIEKQKLDKSDKIYELMENIDVLSSIDVINWVPFRRISEIVHCFVEKEYKQDEKILTEGENGNEFYIIKKGAVQIYSNSIDKDFTKICYRGDYFGESSLIGENKRLANVKALTDTKLLVINSVDFEWIFDFDQQTPNYTLSPLKMINNLSEIRKKKNAEFINKNKSISKMTENEKCMLNMLIVEKEIKKGQYLWRKNENTDFCVIIKNGKFRMKAPYGKVPINFSVNTGNMIGDFPNLLQNEKSRSSLVCEKEGVYFEIKKSHLDMFLSQYPAFFLQLKNKYVIY